MSAKRIYAAVTVLAAVLSYAGTSQADGPFALRSLRGTWGFSASGTLAGAPAAAVGLVTFDGAGGCVESARLNAGGVVIALTSVQCSYTVNSDGSGSLNVTFAPAGQFTADLVILDAGEFHFIVSDPTATTVASGVAKTQEPGH
jgi:hypothetical protein